MAFDQGLLFDSSPLVWQPFASTPPSESTDDIAECGGLVYDHLNKFAVMRNLIAPNNKLFIPTIIKQHTYADYLQANRAPFVAAAQSVGRVRFSVRTNTGLFKAPILSGWVAGSDTTRYFISSNLGLDGSSPIGLVCLSPQWDGEDPSMPHDDFFVVKLEAQSIDLSISIWLFDPDDISRVPPPLPVLPRPLNRGDNVVAIGYAMLATNHLVRQYFQATDAIFTPRMLPPPTVDLVNSVFRPDSRSFAPGVITDELDTPTGRIYAFKGSLYRGHSGSPVLTLDQGVAKVGAVVHGVTHPPLNFNTVVATNVGSGAAVFAQYAT